MYIRSIAPLRLGLAGGGTDVSPYSDDFGGAILNATINMYAFATIEPLEKGKGIYLYAADREEEQSWPEQKELPVDGKLDLMKGVYNRLIKDYKLEPQSFRITTHVDAPAGSGLGTSSTLVVAILGAFAEWLRLPLGEYDMARLAFEIERKDLQMAGGKQDQYAATFGGVNFMEFYEDDKVIVNPLRIKSEYLNEMSFNILLYYTETSRISSDIIAEQTRNVEGKKMDSIEAMHKIKDQAIFMKEALLKGDFDRIGELLDYGWRYKKAMAEGISNSLIDGIYQKALEAGATGGKISGAGGGGFMIFYCPGNSRYKVMKALNELGGSYKRYDFVNEGLTTWKIG